MVEVNLDLLRAIVKIVYILFLVVYTLAYLGEKDGNRRIEYLLLMVFLILVTEGLR